MDTIVTETGTSEVVWRVEKRRPQVTKTNRNGGGAKRYRRGTIQAVQPREAAEPVSVATVNEEPTETGSWEAWNEFVASNEQLAPAPMTVTDREVLMTQLLCLTDWNFVRIISIVPFGDLELIEYTIQRDPDIILCWKAEAAGLNKVMVEFQRLRQDAGRLMAEGISFWEGRIVPYAIIADLTAAEKKFIKDWVFDVVKNCRTVPGGFRPAPEWFETSRRWSRNGSHPLDILGVH